MNYLVIDTTRQNEREVGTVQSVHGTVEMAASQVADRWKNCGKTGKALPVIWAAEQAEVGEVVRFCDERFRHLSEKEMVKWNETVRTRRHQNLRDVSGKFLPDSTKTTEGSIGRRIAFA
jgi:hypothetical protein